MHRSALAAIALGAILASAGFASAEEKKFTANLAAASEVPPNDSAGTGTAEITFDTESKELTWTVEFSGLTGPATGAHFHGPAAEGENAGVAVAIEGTESPLSGSATLTDEQVAQLEGGMWYVNIHTEANPDGEIRGQVAAGM
ncbi:MAG: CHRD domain-containing protein [Propylenella sp.]